MLILIYPNLLPPENYIVSLSSFPDSHHGYFRFGWQMLKPNGEIFTQGSFFGEINERQKIIKLVGFVDENR